jgi:hypothetical protein
VPEVSPFWAPSRRGLRWAPLPGSNGEPQGEVSLAVMAVPAACSAFRSSPSSTLFFRSRAIPIRSQASNARSRAIRSSSRAILGCSREISRGSHASKPRSPASKSRSPASKSRSRVSKMRSRVTKVCSREISFCSRVSNSCSRASKNGSRETRIAFPMPSNSRRPVPLSRSCEARFAAGDAREAQGEAMRGRSRTRTNQNANAGDACSRFVESRGIEPLTSSMPWMRSPS